MQDILVWLNLCFFVIDMIWYDHSLLTIILTGVYGRDITFIYSIMFRE